MITLPGDHCPEIFGGTTTTRQGGPENQPNFVSPKMSLVTTPPRVHRTQLSAALYRIAERRSEIDDQGFGAIDCESPGQVLDYVKRNPTRYPDVAERDVHDGLLLWVWQWYESLRDLRTLLQRGVDRGISFKQMGTPLGLGRGARKTDTAARNQRQGVQRRLDRINALLEYDRPDADLSREARRVEVAAAKAKAAPQRDPQISWLVRHHDTVVAVADRLLSVKQHANDKAYSWLIEVVSDRREDSWSPGSMTIMALAVEEMRVQSKIVKMPSQTLVKRALHAVDELCAAFTTLTAPAPELAE